MAAHGGCRQIERVVAKILAGLNVAQRAAVTSPAPVLQVLAPPGSGKTKTLTSRVAYLLSHEQYAPWNVICCTFTIKASREMRERLRGMIGEDLESKLILGTFHSICRRYLVAYGHLIGIPKNFGVADSDDSLNIIKRAVKRLKLSIDPKVARSRISHRKARGKRLEDLQKSTQKNIETQEFATIFQEYEDALALSNLLDYDDLLIRCVDLLRQHPECVLNIEALLIDEFQDTNVVQFELMKLLASAQKRVTIVGDPDQSIYGFRSAEIENLKRMRAFYPDAVVINLEENYRSASAVLKLAQEVIEQDNDRPQKKLKSTHCYGTLPVLRRLPNPHEEAQWIVSEIKRMTAMTGNLIHHGDIAILLRSAFLSLLIEKALANVGIPYRMVGGRRFFDRAEVRLLLDYLRAISHPDNTSALLSVINTPARKLGDTTVKELMKVSEGQKESLWSICNKVLNGQITLDKKLAKPAEQGLVGLMSLIKKARKNMESMKAEEAPGKLLEYVIKSLGYQDFLKRQYPEDHEERWENVRELVTQAADTSLHVQVPDEALPVLDGVTQEQVFGAQEVLSRFLANVVLSTEVESNEEGEQKPRVTISTIHSAKGLEWPVVFVPAVYEGSIPHSRADDTSEERRLLYVAMTRAQALLYMTFPTMQSRDESESILSQFLPPKILPFISHTGPIFTDRAIGEVASVLRRISPSQEAITKGHTSLKENESHLDDIWPEDGSRRKNSERLGNQSVSFVLQKGQTLSDALRADSTYNQRSKFSALAYSDGISMQAPTTMTNVSAYSTSSMTLNFTTANEHLKSLPKLNTRETPIPSLVKSASEGMAHLSKKPRLTKSTSGQGSIASFLHNGSLKPQHDSEITRKPSGSNQTQNPNTLDKQVMASSEPPIPAALLAHKLSYGTPLLNKRPWSTTNNTQVNQHTFAGKANHSSTSGSFIQEHRSSDSIVKPEGSKVESYTVKPLVTTTGSSFMPSSSTSTHSIIMASKNTTTSFQPNSFHSSQLNRLGRPNPLNNMQGNVLGSGTGLTRKTLGVRRSMNGWENRTNK